MWAKILKCARVGGSSDFLTMKVKKSTETGNDLLIITEILPGFQNSFKFYRIIGKNFRKTLGIYIRMGLGGRSKRIY